jgi:hypothetical protein
MDVAEFAESNCRPSQPRSPHCDGGTPILWLRPVPAGARRTHSDQVLPLPPKAFETLLLLVPNPGHLRSRFCARFWRKPAPPAPAFKQSWFWAMSPHGLRVQMNRNRQERSSLAWGSNVSPFAVTQEQASSGFVPARKVTLNMLR